jgi:hypothetical protein
MESRVAVLEQIARTTSASLERIERRFDAVDRRFDTFERRMDALVSDQRADFRWLLGIMLGGFGALLGVMAHGFHWL